jgi:hypothetical protein
MILLGMLGWLLVSVTAPACPFCTMSGETLLNLAEQSNLIVFGSLKSAKRAEDPNDPAAGSSVLEIETVIKDHPQFKGKTLEISRFFEQEMEGKYKFLVFCDVDKKGHIDPYRGIAVPNDSDIARYIKGALALPKEPATAILLRLPGQQGHGSFDRRLQGIRKFRLQGCPQDRRGGPFGQDRRLDRGQGHPGVSSRSVRHDAGPQWQE